MILGLDVSTSCTGWCILDENKKLVTMGFISLTKEKGLFSKAEKVKHSLSLINITHPISKIFIEKNLQAFRPGLSSASTLLTLAQFNGIVSYLCHQEFSLDPEFINVNSARKILGIKLVRKSNGGKPTKHQILDWVSDELNDIDHSWPIKVLKSGPRKGQTVLQPGCYDMADAYVIACSGFLKGAEL